MSSENTTETSNLSSSSDCEQYGKEKTLCYSGMAEDDCNSYNKYNGTSGSPITRNCTTLACRNNLYLDSKKPIPEDIIQIFQNFRIHIFSMRSQMQSHTIVKKIKKCIHLAKDMRHHMYALYFMYTHIAIMYDMNDQSNIMNAVLAFNNMRQYVKDNNITDALIVSILSYLNFLESMFYYHLNKIEFKAVGNMLQDNWQLIQSFESGVESSVFYFTFGNELQRMLTLRDYEDEKDVKSLKEVVEIIKGCNLLLQNIGIEIFPSKEKNQTNFQNSLFSKNKNLEKINVEKNLKFLRLICFKCYRKHREIMLENNHVYPVTKAYFSLSEEKTFPLLKMIRVFLDFPESNAGRNRKYTGDLSIAKELMQQAEFELANLPQKSLKFEMNIALSKAGLKFREYQKLLAVPFPDEKQYYEHLLNALSIAKQFLQRAINMASQSPTVESDLVQNFYDEIKKIKNNTEDKCRNKELQTSNRYRKMLELRMRKLNIPIPSQSQNENEASFTTDNSNFEGTATGSSSENDRNSDFSDGTRSSLRTGSTHISECTTDSDVSEGRQIRSAGMELDLD